MNREDLLAGTRPEIGDKTLMTSADGFDGYEIMEYKGMVWGLAVRAKDLGQDCGMACKHLSGGELSSYTQLGDESRQKCVDRMLAMARRQGGNAVINVRFDIGGAASGATEVVSHGTAVIIEPIRHYVPVGALGNLMAEMVDAMKDGRS